MNCPECDRMIQPRRTHCDCGWVVKIEHAPIAYDSAARVPAAAPAPERRPGDLVREIREAYMRSTAYKRKHGLLPEEGAAAPAPQAPNVPF